MEEKQVIDEVRREGQEVRIIYRGDLPVHVNTHPVRHFCLLRLNFPGNFVLWFTARAV